MKQKLSVFFRTLFIVILSFFCLCCLIFFTAQADTSTRSVGFGDPTPAIGTEEYADSIEITFFGNEISVNLTRIRGFFEELNKFLYCCFPRIIRLIEKIFSFA